MFWRLSCHDRSIPLRSDGITDALEVTLVYFDILGTKSALEKWIPKQRFNTLVQCYKYTWSNNYEIAK